MNSQRTLEKRRIPEILQGIRQNSKLPTEQYVLDFLDIWYEIHTLTEGATLEDALTISKLVLDSHVLPFFKKYKHRKDFHLIHKFKGDWEKVIKRGGVKKISNLIFDEITIEIPAP